MKLILFALCSLTLLMFLFSRDFTDSERSTGDTNNDFSSSTQLPDAVVSTTATPRRQKVAVELFLMRHAQGDHNVHGIDVFDAPLTRLGRQQAMDSGVNLRANFFAASENLLILASPLRRTIETAILAFPPSFLNSNSGGSTGNQQPKTKATKRILLLPELMEIHDKPCDTGVPPDQFVSRGYITREEAAFFDMSRLTPTWFDKGPMPDNDERGLKRGQRLQSVLSAIIRKEIAKIEGTARFNDATEKKLRIVIVFHGGINRFWLFGGPDKRRMHHAEVFRCWIHDEVAPFEASATTEDLSTPTCDFKHVSLPNVVTM